MSELHFVWTAEPGINLLETPAVVVRAYLESTTIASLGDSLDYLYPGFDHAVDPNQPQGHPRSTLSLWPEPGASPRLKSPFVGAARYHLLRITDSGRSVTIAACHWMWSSASQQPNGLYESGYAGTGPATGIVVLRFNLIAPAAPTANGLVPQQGPSSFATTDVFGNWRVTGFLHAIGPIGAGPEWPEFDQDMAGCIARAPDTVERRQFLTTGDHPRSDFPTPSPSPGWPVQAQ